MFNHKHGHQCGGKCSHTEDDEEYDEDEVLVGEFEEWDDEDLDDELDAEYGVEFDVDPVSVAVLGATGLVGREIINQLQQMNFPLKKLYALASRESVGKKISFGESDEVIEVMSVDDCDWREVDILFSAVSDEIAARIIPEAIEAGVFVIDKSSYYRMNPDVALVVPQVNFRDIFEARNRSIVASPNCCVIPLVAVLGALDKEVKVKRVVVSTYQSVSGAGKDAMDELYSQTKNYFMYDKVPNKFFERRIAFNLIPKIGDINTNEYYGYTTEEKKISMETSKILGRHIPMSVTCVRVPVFIGHSLSVNIEFEDEFDADDVADVLEEASGFTKHITVIRTDGEEQYVTPVEVVGDNTIFVSRIRNDFSKENTVNLWISTDNLRRGAAANAVEIALFKLTDEVAESLGLL